VYTLNSRTFFPHRGFIKISKSSLLFTFAARDGENKSPRFPGDTPLAPPGCKISTDSVVIEHLYQRYTLRIPPKIIYIYVYHSMSERRGWIECLYYWGVEKTRTGASRDRECRPTTQLCVVLYLKTIIGGPEKNRNISSKRIDDDDGYI